MLSEPDEECSVDIPANTSRSEHVIITSKRSFDVIITCLLRCVFSRLTIYVFWQVSTFIEFLFQICVYSNNAKFKSIWFARTLAISGRFFFQNSSDAIIILSWGERQIGWCGENDTDLKIADFFRRNTWGILLYINIPQKYFDTHYTQPIIVLKWGLLLYYRQQHNTRWQNFNNLQSSPPKSAEPLNVLKSAPEQSRGISTKMGP